MTLSIILLQKWKYNYLEKSCPNIKYKVSRIKLLGCCSSSSAYICKYWSRNPWHINLEKRHKQLSINWKNKFQDFLATKTSKTRCISVSSMDAGKIFFVIFSEIEHEYVIPRNWIYVQTYKYSNIFVPMSVCRRT